MPAAFYLYQTDITDLQPGTQYSYTVSVDGQVLASSPSQSFRTPAPGNFSFLAFGDSGADSAQQLSLIQLMAAEPNIAKVIHVGDLAYEAGTFAQFETNYFGPNAPLMQRLSFFATPGNHEYDTDSAAPYLAGHVAPVSGVPAADLGRYYSFDWGDAHFVSVDSNLLPTGASTRMLSWLDSDLAASGKFWKIVFLHHPPYPTGTHLGDPICALVQQNVNPIVERHGVQLVLTGHEHGYERSYPLVNNQPVSAGMPSTTYVITGGGGGVLETVGSLPQCALSVAAYNYLRVDVTGTALTFRATGLNGAVIDSVTLNPPPVLAPNGVVNAGDFSSAMAPGSLVSIFGQNLAIRPQIASGLPLPDQLGGVTVSANGLPAPLVYVSPTQINAQMPYAVSGQVNVQVTTANGSASTVVTVVPTAPSILAVISQNAPVSSANPCMPGGYVTLYLTGLGAPSVPVATGQATSSANPMAVQVQVMLGNTTMQPSYAGMAPGFAGVSQVNLVLPPNLTGGVYSLSVAAGGVISPPVNLTVAGSANASGAAPPVDGNATDPNIFRTLRPAAVPAFSLR